MGGTCNTLGKFGNTYKILFSEPEKEKCNCVDWTHICQCRDHENECMI